MSKSHKPIVLLFASMLISFSTMAQPEFKYGLGGGVNFSNVTELTSFPLFEDITGEGYSSKYSSLFSNLGSQYFFYGELVFKSFILVTKPGIYNYNFGKTDEIVFNSETLEQTNGYLLRYLNFPVEARITFGSGNLKPYIGGGIAYGHLLHSGGSTASFIKPKFSVAPVAGAYYSFENFDLVLDAGYNFGLHSITKEDSRFEVGSTTPFSQSDIKLNDLYVSLSVIFSLSKQQSRGALDCPTPARGPNSKRR